MGIKHVLVVNTGSSSNKFAIFGDEKKPIWKSEGSFEELDHLPDLKIDVVGHRVVHGGEKFRETTHLTPKVEEEIATLNYLAPLHNPACLNGIKETKKRFPKAQQYAVFDTAFHGTIPEVAYTYAGPFEWRARGIRKYGFHGVSYQYISSFVPTGKCVICHLGSGASLAALLDGKSIDTTMGFSPLDGLVMGTRSGTIDPSILIHLILQKQLPVTKVEHILNFESGLLGVSGLSSDMKEIENAAQHDNSRAKLALDLFAYRFKQQLAQMIAALEGIDTLVFTAGIGEHSPTIRRLLCPEYLGIELDPFKNEALSTDNREISTPNSRVKVLVIPTQEEWQIAQECLKNS